MVFGKQDAGKFDSIFPLQAYPQYATIRWMVNLDNLRHSTSHLLAAAIASLWPKAKPTLGPPIEEGFYYDFADLSISDEDLPKIEEKMKQILKNWSSFEKIEVSPSEARKTFKDNPFKLELIEELEKSGQKITLYESICITTIPSGSASRKGAGFVGCKRGLQIVH